MGYRGWGQRRYGAECLLGCWDGKSARVGHCQMAGACGVGGQKQAALA